MLVFTEFKSGQPAFGTAIKQLAVRLRALRLMVCEVSGLGPNKVTLIGRIFTRKAVAAPDYNRQEMARQAFKKHGFSLYIETLL